MKNDMDELLNKMYKNGRLDFSGDAANKVLKDNEAISRVLKDNMEKLAQQTQADLEDLQRNLHADGLNQAVKEAASGQTATGYAAAAKGEGQSSLAAEVPATAQLTGDALDEAFEKAKQALSDRVIGQEAFIDSLLLDFKRPLVAGYDEAMPKARVIISGKEGTGRHSALAAAAEALSQNGVLPSGEIRTLDLSHYDDAQEDRLFVQDLYAALESGCSILVLENADQCHNATLQMVTSLFRNGQVELPGRYSAQKGMLVDIGSALVPNAVSSLSAKGRYLFLITDSSEAKLTDVFGAPFLSGLDDFCKTEALSEEALHKIADGILRRFCETCEQKLSYKLYYTDAEVAVLSQKYSADLGVEDIVAHLQALYKVISEDKLKSGRKAADGTIAGENGSLFIRMGEDKIEIPADEQSQKAVDAVKKELDEIVGLSFIKEYILSLEDNVKVQQMRKEKGLKAEFPSMHMIFTGNPGTGKTTIARIVSRYLKAIGVLAGGQLVEVTRADLVGKYVGHTAPLTQKAIDSALGGVLFIDEAYSLHRGNDDSFGLECIDTLVKGMEDHRDELVVILAGYSKEMEVFLTANSGLKSRFPHIIEFPDYTAQELLDITKSIVKSKGYRMDAECDEKLLAYYDTMQKTGDPRTNGNGRMARNKVEEAILNCSKRAAGGDGQTDLELLVAGDFEA